MNTSLNPLRIAVVGLGIMGQNHLRILESMPFIQISAVVDINEEQAKKIAQRIGCPHFLTLEPLVGLVDAAIIAVPSILHHAVGHFLLSNGIHCLIEKPLAANEDECLSLIQAADSAGKILMVGHVERFNPAVRQLQKYLKNGQVKIQAIEARRMSDAGQRILDTDVAADLMIHDLDVICSLIDAPVQCVKSHSLTSERGLGDYVNALLKFADGSTASLTASRVTQNKIRELLITTDKGSLVLDYLSQKLYLYHKSDRSAIPETSFDYARENFLIRPSEPLALELQHFIGAITQGTDVLIDGRDALKTLRIVWEIQSQITADSS